MGKSGNNDPTVDFLGLFQFNYLKILVIQIKYENDFPCCRVKTVNYSSSGNLAGFLESVVKGIDEIRRKEDGFGGMGKDREVETRPSQMDDKKKSHEEEA